MPMVRARKVFGGNGVLKAFLDFKGGLTRGAVPDTDLQLRQAQQKVKKLEGEAERAETRQDIVQRFRNLYHKVAQRGGTWRDTRWFGIPVQKCPLDLHIYQEIICETRPDVIVETGTAGGGSALYMAHVLDALEHGRIVTADIEERPGRPSHERITYLTGSSTDEEIISEVRESIGGERAMVILDSNHTEEHVREELGAYWPMVAVGCYLIVEDTNLAAYPVEKGMRSGAMKAVEDFLKAYQNKFVSDRSREKLLLTFNPKGYLRRFS